MCLDLARWSASLRANDLIFFLQANKHELLECGLGTATAPLPITCIRAIAALAGRWSRLAHTRTAFLPRRSSVAWGAC